MTSSKKAKNIKLREAKTLPVVPSHPSCDEQLDSLVRQSYKIETHKQHIF